MASSATNSYQHTAYQKIAIQNDENHHVKELEAASQGLVSRSRLIKTAVAAVVLAIVWFFVSSHRQQAVVPSSCPSWSVVVDDRGIIEDGPGSEGICDDPVHWYDDQLIDHSSNDRSHNNKWKQKYFMNDGT